MLLDNKLSLIFKKILCDNELFALTGFLIPQPNLHLTNVKVVMQAVGRFGGPELVRGIHIVTQVLINIYKEHSDWRSEILILGSLIHQKFQDRNLYFFLHIFNIVETRGKYVCVCVCTCVCTCSHVWFVFFKF